MGYQIGDEFYDDDTTSGLPVVHYRDDHCTLDSRGVCTGCGVGHGEECAECGQRAYHVDGCKVAAQ